MDKNILKQYDSLKREMTEIRRKITQIEKQIKRLERLQEETGTVKDVVKGGEGGNQTFHIEGYPEFRDLQRARRSLTVQKTALLIREEKCANLLDEINIFVASVDDSIVRRIIEYRYLNGGATWVNVADRIGGGNSSETVRKILERYMEKNNDKDRAD